MCLLKRAPFRSLAVVEVDNLSLDNMTTIVDAFEAVRDVRDHLDSLVEALNRAFFRV